VADENQTPHAPADMPSGSYHCPSAACDECIFLKPEELGRPQICRKCGLVFTVGCQKPPHSSSREEERSGNSRPQMWFLSDQSGRTGLDQFLQLAQSIGLSCWRQIHVDDASREANNEVLQQAYRLYKGHLQPWLSAMSKGPDAESIATARKAAAHCLLSLSGAYFCVNNPGAAETLALEAKALAIKDHAIETEIQGQLKEIRSEQDRLKRDSLSRQAKKSFWLRPAAIYLPLLGLVISFVLIVQLGERVQPSPESRVLAALTQFERIQSSQAKPPSAAPSPGTVALGKIAELQPATSPAPRDVTGAKVWEPAEIRNPAHSATTGTSAACEVNLGEMRPANGAEPAFLGAGDGHGSLVVTNGNPQDAAVLLADQAGQQDDRLMYVRSGMQATMTGIPPGQYQIKFQIGKNWDERAEQFRCVIGTDVFDKTRSFTEEERADSIEYSRLSITLHKVVGGKARTSAIAQQAFVRRRGYQLSHSK
jgi:hypothetical protein